MMDNDSIDHDSTASASEHDFAESDVFALDNIRLELPYAGAGSRVMAGIIDYVLFYGLAFAVIVATVSALAIVGGAGVFDALGGWVVGIGVLLVFLLEAFWFAVQEILMGGQTLGKRALGLRTVAAQGHSASSVSLLLRNLVKTLDVVVGGWFLVFDKRSRRIGDRLGRTVVIHELPASGTGAVHRVPRGWGPEKVAVAEELLDRLFVLDDTRARLLSERVLHQIVVDDPSFLEHVPTELAPTTRLAAAFGTLRRGVGGVPR